MPCDTRLRAGQTITQRKDEIRSVVEKLAKALATGRAKVKIGPKGSIAFDGISEVDKSGVTDACAYRRIMSSGSVLAKQAIMKAELLSGTTVTRQTVANGMHQHSDGVWHANHKH